MIKRSPTQRHPPQNRYKIDLKKIEPPQSSLAVLGTHNDVSATVSKVTKSRENTNPKLELPAIRYQKASQIFSNDEYNTTNVDKSSISLFSCLDMTTERQIGKKDLFRITDFKIDFEKIEDKE